MIETPSPLENLAACAVSYLVGILFTLVLMSYIEAAIASECGANSTSSEA